MQKLPIPIPTDIPLFAVPKILAGFLYGMTTDNKLVEIEACYDGTKFMIPEV